MTGKRFLCSSAICGLALIMLSGYSQSAAAQTSRIYFAGYMGLNSFNDSKFNESTTGSSGDFGLDNGLSFAGALGIRLSQQLRFEGEYNYASTDIASVDIAGAGSFDIGGTFKSKVIFANLYYDLDVPWKIQPFIGGGLGYGWHSGEIDNGSGLLVSTSSEDANFMWNVAAGLKYRPTTDMAFTAGYRYVDSLDLNFGSYDFDYGAHEFRLGLEWDLPVLAR
jgi:opacity protein-like surface antigen